MVCFLYLKRKKWPTVDYSEKTKLFEQLPIPKAVAKLSVPTVLSSLVMILYSMADTYFVGMLNNPVQNAAVALSTPVLLAFNAVNNLFGVGCSSMMSRALGRKDHATVRRTAAFGFYCAIACGLLFSLLCTVFRPGLLQLLGADATTAEATRQYLFWTVSCGAAPAILNVVMAHMVRSEGAALHASIGTMSGCLLNIILDPFFILPFGLNMGAAGAGLATFISNCVACCYFFVLLYVRRKNTFVCLSPRQFALRKEIVLGVFAVGVPASIQNLLNVTGMTILNNFTSGYGADAVAAMGIAHKITMVPLQMLFGVSQGIMPFVSYNFAAKNYPRMKACITFVLKMLLPVTAVVTTLFFICAGWIITLFMDAPLVVQYGTRFLQAQCLMLPFLFLDFLAVGIFQAVGYGRAALVFALLRKIVLEIPFLFLLNALWPLYGLAAAQPAAEVFLAVAAVIMLARIFRRPESVLKQKQPRQ